MKHLLTTVALAMAAFMFTACNNNGNQNADNATDDVFIDMTVDVEVPEHPGELVVYRYGIGDVLQLGRLIDELPAQVEGLYDKFEVRQEELEGDTTAVVYFTLDDKNVMIGYEDVSYHLGFLTITSDKVILRSGDKEWHVGDKPDGMKLNAAQNYEQNGVIIDTDAQGRISSFQIGF